MHLITEPPANTNMADMSHRTYLRDRSGPRAVDAADRAPEKSRGSTRRHKDSDDREKHRSKRSNSDRSSPKGSGHRRKVSNSKPSNTFAERPSFELNVIEQPARGIQLGMLVEASVMVSLRLPSADRVISSDCVDTSRLLAITSLVADTRNGERMSLEAGSLTGQKMYDSIHPIPEECADTLARNQPCRIALGYFSFPGLLIRQAGTYRIRTTLVKMSNSADAGATSLLAVDSEPIKVERRGSGSLRRHQRVHG